MHGATPDRQKNPLPEASLADEQNGGTGYTPRVKRMANEWHILARKSFESSSIAP